MWKTRTDEKLEEGMRIRLAGREAVITVLAGGASGTDSSRLSAFEFEDNFSTCIAALENFPSLEIWIGEPRISREAACELKSFMHRELGLLSDKEHIHDMIDRKIESMVEEGK